MSGDHTWSIGELAEHAGVTVKTVRFYSDRGLLPEAARSAGGHRRYRPEALDRLRTIRSLRGLDLSVPEVGRFLDREDTLEEIIAGQLREVGSRLAELRWRESALHLLRDCAPDERAERLRLVGAVSVPPSTAPVARFWRGWLPARLPARLVTAIVDRSVPQPPADPTPAQVLAFARLHALVTRPCEGPGGRVPVAHRPRTGPRPAVLFGGLVEAHTLAAPELRAHRPPRPGEALDCFVAAYARSWDTADTPAFRRRLAGLLLGETRIERYWQLAAELSDPAEPTPGATDTWLRAALNDQVGEPAA